MPERRRQGESGVRGGRITTAEFRGLLSGLRQGELVMALESELRDGLFLRGPDSSLYVVFQGKRYQVKDDPLVLAQVGLPMNEVVEVPSNDLAQVAEAPLALPDTFPVVHFDTGNADMGAGHFMQTEGGVTIADGTLSAITHTFSVTWLGGFHGAVFACLEDANGNPVPWTPRNQPYLHRYGVDGRWIGNSDRHDAWILNHTQADAARAVAVRLWHSYNPDSFQTVLNKWVAAGDSIKKLADDVAAIAKDYKQVFG
jgi:hypothetical protein